MKTKLSIILCLVMFMGWAGITNGQEVDGSLDVRVENRKVPERPANRLMEIKEGVKDKIETLRASTTRPKLIRATSSPLFKRSGSNDQKREEMKKMRFDNFESRKASLVKILEVSIKNLANISSRLEERILKAEEGGRDMTEAKASLIIADKKLADAKVAVQALVDFKHEGIDSSAQASASIEIDLSKPRQIGDTAIKAVKEAKEAYRKVIQHIAHNMGLGDGKRDIEASTKTTTEATVN